MTRTSKWRGWSFIGAAALASTLGVRTVQAQYNPIAFGIVAGASFPISDFGDAANIRWHVGGLFQWQGPAFPLGIRGEVVYHQFGSKFDDEASLHILTATVNGVFMFPVTEPATVRPYIIGGGGLYRVGCSDCGGLDSENKGGINRVSSARCSPDLRLDRLHGTPYIGSKIRGVSAAPNKRFAVSSY